MALPSDWAVGERYDIEYLRTRERFEDEARTSYDVVSTPIRVEVLEKDAEGYVLRWAFGESRFHAEPENVRSMVARFQAHLFDNRHMELRADAAGQVLAVRNLEALLDEMKLGLTAAAIWLDSRGFPEAEAARIRERLARLTSAESIDQLTLKPPRLFLTVSGSALELGRAARYDSVLANPFSGEPLPTKGEILLRDFEPERDWAVIELKQAPDPELLSRSMWEKMQAAARAADESVPAERDLPLLMLLDEARYEYDTARGWPRKVTVERTILAGEYRRVVRHEFTVVKPDGK